MGRRRRLLARSSFPPGIASSIIAVRRIDRWTRKSSFTAFPEEPDAVQLRLMRGTGNRRSGPRYLRCVRCGVPLSPETRADAKFCSGRCRTAAHRHGACVRRLWRPGVHWWSHCPICNKQILIGIDRTIEARFCSDKCATAAARSDERRYRWIERINLDEKAREVEARIKRTKLPPRDSEPTLLRCPACGAVISNVERRSDRDYCSGACRTRAWRARQRHAGRSAGAPNSSCDLTTE
jgi:predicted nucleic acid-binding Zn ribbon protein